MTVASTFSHRQTELMVMEQLAAINTALNTQSVNVDKLQQAMAVYTKTNSNEMTNRKEWQSVDDKALELELTRTIKSHYEAKNPGSSVQSVNVSEVYSADGQAFVQLDGMLAVRQNRGFTELLLVEAKHKVTQDKIDSKQKKFEKFNSFLQRLESEDEGIDDHPACLASKDALRRYHACKVSWFIGGVSFSDSLSRYARRQGFHVVVLDGSRFEVLSPTRT